MAVRLIVPGPTRFERQLVVDNFLDRLQAVSDETRRQANQSPLDYQVRRLGFHGEVARDPQFEVKVSFSDDDGGSFDSPLTSMEGNRVYHLRIEFSQFQASPLLHGVALTYQLPAGWAFNDALPDLIYEVAVCNPLVIMRTMISPTDPGPAAVIVTVTELFQ